MKRSVRWQFFYAFFLALSAWTFCHGSGITQTPVLPHNDPAVEKEFQNIYQAVTSPTISTGIAQNFTIINATITNLGIGGSLKIGTTTYAPLIITAWANYTPTFSAGMGTTSNVNVSYRRVGDTLEVHGIFEVGVVAGSVATMSLPSGLLVDNSGVFQNNSLIGYIAGSNGVNVPRYVIADANANVINFGIGTAGSNVRTKQNANSIFNNNEDLVFQLWVPINGWTTGS